MGSFKSIEPQARRAGPGGRRRPRFWPAPAAAQTRDQILARLQVRRPGGAVRGRDRQGLLQGRRPRRHHRLGRGLARADQPRRLRHLRHGLRRHQLADQVPRRQPGDADQGRVHGLQQAGRSRSSAARAAASRKPKDLEGKKLGAPAAGRRLCAVEDLRPGQRHRRLQGDDRERRLPGARADAGRTARSTPSPASRSRPSST